MREGPEGPAGPEGAQSARQSATLPPALSAARYACLAQSGLLGLINTDASFRPLDVNETLSNMLGYSRAELLAPSFRFADITPPEWRPTDELARAQITKSGSCAVREKEYLRKDGARIPVLVGGTTVAPDDHLFFVVDLREPRRVDVGERHRMEAQLRSSAAQLTAVHRELESFSYSVAHDLRAPLRGITGFAQILFEDHKKQLNDDAQECLREIRDNAQRMSLLIDALLTLSRVTRGEMKPTRVDLSAMARTVVARLSAEEPARPVDLVVQGGLVAVMDQALARTVLENLLGNAWKFTMHSTAPRVELGCTGEGGETVYFVRDNGAGFDMAFADKLFAPFARLHSAGEFPGIGIGLALVSRIVNRHGGRVWAQAQVGGGATISFSLPAPGFLP